MSAAPFLDSMYLPDDRDRVIFGDLYRPPARFVHGEWHQVVEIQKDRPDGDGYDVAIDESRIPARFFRLRVLSGENSVGKPRPTNVSLSTGSGDGAGLLILAIAKAMSEGMLGFDVEESA